MHKIFLEKPSAEFSPYDVLSYYVHVPKNNLFLLDTTVIQEQYDTVIYSLNTLEPAINRAHAQVGVISYVPPMDSPQWPQFYLNLCSAQIIASDSFVKKQLDELSYPTKRWINLDAAVVTVEDLYGGANISEEPTIACMQPSSKVWHKYSKWLANASEVNVIDITPAEHIDDAGILISYEDYGQLLTTTLSRVFQFVWFPRRDDVYLDGRHTFVLSDKLKHLADVNGQAADEMLAKAFIEFTEELTALFVHSKTSVIPVFRSNVTIVDRIFNELMKS